MGAPMHEVTVKKVKALASECYTINEIARRLDCSARTVRRRLFGTEYVRKTRNETYRRITRRNAETLSYLQGLGPVGTWVRPSNKHMASDLGINHAQLCGHLVQLCQQGFIERKGPRMERHYRVLIRLEHPSVRECCTYLFTSTQKRAASLRVWAKMNMEAHSS